MFIRGTRVQTPPDEVDAAIANFKDKIVPTARATPGCIGAVLLVDRKTGAAIGSTYWDSARSMAAAEHMGVQTRTQAAADVRGTQIVNVERFEVVIMERSAPPKEGTFARLNSGNSDPAKIDALIDFVKGQVLPVVKAQKGYRALLMGVDRQTGRTVTSTTWDTLEDLHASEPKVAGLRKQSVQTADASGPVEVEIFEGAVVDLAVPAAAMSGH
jgi:quinol monooxygenase YgiN